MPAGVGDVGVRWARADGDPRGPERRAHALQVSARANSKIALRPLRPLRRFVLADSGMKYPSTHLWDDDEEEGG